MKRISLILMIISISCFSVSAAVVSDFENLTLADESYENGSNLNGWFKSGAAKLYNNFNTTYQSWQDFAYSNMTDTTTPGYGNQYSVIAGSGANASDNFALAYDGKNTGDFEGNHPKIDIYGDPAVVSGVYLTNTTYSYLSMLNGDTYTDPYDTGDFTTVTIHGYDDLGSQTGTVDFNLADFRNGNSYIVDEWTWVDLSGLGEVASLEFAMSSSQLGDFNYMNNPAYFAMDDLTIETTVPEPATVGLLGLGMVFLRRKKFTK